MIAVAVNGYVCWTMLTLMLSPTGKPKENIEVQELCRQGETAYEKHDYHAAIAAYDTALYLDPKHLASLIGRGHAYRMKQDLERSIADYGEAIRLLSGDSRIHDEQGFAGNLTTLREAHHLRRRLADVYRYRADAATAERDYKWAIEDLTRALSLAPHEPAWYFVRGKAYLEDGDFEHALSDLNETIRHNPKHASAFYYRGLCYQSWMEYERALADFEASAKLDPQHYQASFTLARLVSQCHALELRNQDKILGSAIRGDREIEMAGREEYEIKTPRFAIPMALNDNRPENIEKICLFVSKDEGKNWKHEKDCNPRDQLIMFKAPHDGRYWFAVQVVLRNGARIPRTLDRVVPALKVYVNSEGKMPKPQETNEELKREVEELRMTVEHLEKRIKELESDHKPK